MFPELPERSLNHIHILENLNTPNPTDRASSSSWEVFGRAHHMNENYGLF
jgi:hypothetical protein